MVQIETVSTEIVSVEDFEAVTERIYIDRTTDRIVILGNPTGCTSVCITPLPR